MKLIKAFIHHVRAPEVIQAMYPLMVALLFSVASCALQDSKSAATPDSEFSHALHVCRSQHTGATNQKIALKATEEHVSKCLALRGWLPSGTHP
jgi:hypothetical protein